MLIILFSQGPVGNAAVEQGDETGEEMLGLHLVLVTQACNFPCTYFRIFLSNTVLRIFVQECDEVYKFPPEPI